MFAQEFLLNKSGIVTGGNTKLGMEIVETLHDFGAAVTVLGRQSEKFFWKKAPMRRGVNAVLSYKACDIRNQEDIAQAVEAHIERFKKIDFIIHGAGVDFLCPLEQLTSNAFQNSLMSVVQSGFMLFQESFPWLRQSGRGRIISIGHYALETHTRFAAHVGVTKSALLNLTQGAALEWARFGITANMISPGPVESMSLYRTTPGSNLKEKLKNSSPQGRFVTGHEIGQTIAFLISDGAQMITGQHITVDGGLSLQGFSFLPAEIHITSDPRTLVVQADDMPAPEEQETP